MTDDLAGYSPDTFANTIALLSIGLDAKAAIERLKSIDAKAAETKKADAARAAELDAREAEIAKREAASDEHEAET